MTISLSWHLQQTNKQTINLKVIKDNLNVLDSIYKEHFKLQRDKYGAHFQHLDFGIRLQNWSEINADKANFFTDIPREISYTSVQSPLTYHIRLSRLM